jgi:hypothetical protein
MTGVSPWCLRRQAFLRNYLCKIIKGKKQQNNKKQNQKVIKEIKQNFKGY